MLEKQLREVFKERSTILRHLTKTSKELDGIKVNLQSLKNDEQSAKIDIQKLLKLGQKQREEMKSLQESLQNQLKETSEKAEKHQAIINFLKTEMERKTKMIRGLHNEAQQLMDLEQKLAVAKNELQKAAFARPQQSVSGNKESSGVESHKEGNPSTTMCDSQDEGKTCSMENKENSARNRTAESKAVPRDIVLAGPGWSLQPGPLNFCIA
nr:leucine zipper protein 2-like [Cavia porcellus]